MVDWDCAPAGWLSLVSLLGVELAEPDGEVEPLVLWLDVAPPEAEPAFFSGSVVVVDDELEPDEGALGGVALEELDELDGGVALPPTEAEPDVLPEGAGVVVEDDEAVSRDGDGEVVAEPEVEEVRWSGPRSHAARPRAIATASARVVILMRPPWLGTKKVSSRLRAGSGGECNPFGARSGPR